LHKIKNLLVHREIQREIPDCCNDTGYSTTSVGCKCLRMCSVSWYHPWSHLRGNIGTLPVCFLENHTSLRNVIVLFRFLVNDQRDAQIPFYVFIFIFNSLHVSGTSYSSSGEENCVNTTYASCYSVLVCTRHGHQHRVIVTRGCIGTICLSWWWARCAQNMYRVKNKNKYIERNFCVTLGIYQESLHDIRLKKCKILLFLLSSHYQKNYELLHTRKLLPC